MGWWRLNLFTRQSKKFWMKKLVSGFGKISISKVKLCWLLRNPISFGWYFTFATYSERVKLRKKIDPQLNLQSYSPAIKIAPLEIKETKKNIPCNLSNIVDGYYYYYKMNWNQFDGVRRVEQMHLDNATPQPPSCRQNSIQVMLWYRDYDGFDEYKLNGLDSCDDPFPERVMI